MFPQLPPSSMHRMSTNMPPKEVIRKGEQRHFLNPINWIYTQHKLISGILHYRKVHCRDHQMTGTTLSLLGCSSDPASQMHCSCVIILLAHFSSPLHACMFVNSLMVFHDIIVNYCVIIITFILCSTRSMYVQGCYNLRNV